MEYTKTELKMREVWLNFALETLGPQNREEKLKTLSTMFDSMFQRTEIEIENTENGTITRVPADKFFLSAGNKFILNESGTLTYKHDIKLAVNVPIILKDIKIRQIKKRAKVRAEAEHDDINYANLSNEEYSLKIIINGLYGLFLYVKSMFFNASAAATCTAAGRNVISTSALTVEMMGQGYRPYLIEAHLQIIRIAKEECSSLCELYTVPEVDVETVLKHMLLHYYDDYYAKSFLRHALEELTPDELSVVYLKNNFAEFIKVPEVRNAIVKIYKENLEPRESIDDRDRELEDEIRKVFKHGVSGESVAKFSQCYIANYAKHKIYGPLSKQLKRMAGDLLMGFYFYSGDYVDGVYQQTTVDIFENMERSKIPTVDTDSNVSSLFDECELMNEVFKEYTDQDEYVKEVGTTVIATIIFGGGIDKSLTRYTKAIGVSDEYAHLIEMEEETTMYDLHLTTGKKKYVFSFFLQDGNFNSGVYSKIKIKGLQVIKSDYNSEICKNVITIFKDKVMAKLDKLDYASIIRDTKDLTEKITRMIRSEDYILNKSTVKKSNQEDLAFGDAKNKMLRLWRRLGLPGEIDFPGSYKEVEVKFSEKTLKLIQLTLPDVYKVFEDHVREIKLFKFYRSTINGARKYRDGNGGMSKEELEVKDSVIYSLVENITSKIIKLDTEQLEERFAIRISKELFSSNREENDVKLLRKVFKLGPRDIVVFDISKDAVDIPITFDDIIDNIDKIGLPIDINTVPDFMKVSDYAIIDTEYAETGEMLLSALVDTLGISCPRNKNDKLMVSSALQTY